MEFSFVLLPLGFVFKVNDKSVGLFIGNKICFQENSISQYEFPVWANCSSFITVRKQQNIDYDVFPVDSFDRIEFDLTLETGDKCILVLKIISVRVSFFGQSEFEIQLLDYFAIGND